MSQLTERIEFDFDHHAPDEDRAKDHANVRALLKRTAQTLALNLPDGREKSLVITHLEEAMFWANAAVARQDRP
jgi:hypothetical protein